MNITAAITGDHGTINAALNSDTEWQPDENTQPGRHARRTRWLPWLCRTPSWQAAYNTACLYAALADLYDGKQMTRRVVTGLARAIHDPYCEMGRASDWVEIDPDFHFSSVGSSPVFVDFLKDQKKKDYPGEKCTNLESR
jgi:hypothetical protein